MSIMLLKKNIFTIIKVANFLKKNKVGVIPTDTVYGISGIVPTSKEKIQKLKGRGEEKPFIQLIAKPKDIYTYTDIKIPKNIYKIWPNALTIIVPLKNSELKVAFRCPKDKWLRNVIKFCKKPIYSTSVNRTGQPLLKDIDSILQEFNTELDFIVDGGVLDNSPSTIIDLSENNIKILRQGIIKI